MNKKHLVFLVIALFYFNGIAFSQSCVELEIINTQGDTLRGFSLLPETQEVMRLKTNTDITKTIFKLYKSLKTKMSLHKNLFFSTKIKDNLGYDDKGKMITKKIPYIINTETLKISMQDIQTIKLIARKKIYLPEYDGSIIEVSPELAKKIMEQPLINMLNHSNNFTLDLGTYCALFYNFNSKINQEQLQVLAKKYKALFLPESYDEKTKKTSYFEGEIYLARKEKAINELSAKGIAFCVYYCGD
jgi:hypothetical protein